MCSYYELLGLDRKLSHSPLSQQDLKIAYHWALLEYHPDKRATISPPPAQQKVTVDEVTRAYRTLSDPISRAEYDARLAQAAAEKSTGLHGRVHHTGLETVDLDSLALDKQSHIWSRSCRCGDQNGFIVMEAELEKHVEDGELLVGCKGCSLWLRVLFEVEDAG